MTKDELVYFVFIHFLFFNHVEKNKKQMADVFLNAVLNTKISIKTKYTKCVQNKYSDFPHVQKNAIAY